MNVSAIATPNTIDTFRPQYDVHVVPDGKFWAVKAENLSTYSALFGTQMEAISYGRRQAMEGTSSLIIHGRDGQFREVWNYSS